MIFLLDNCIWRETETILSESGFQYLTLRQLGRPEAANGQVIGLARHRKAILITRDSDFTSLTQYPIGSHEGIIYLKITPATMKEVHSVLIRTLRSLREAQIRGNLLIVTPTTYRIHSS